MPVIPNGYLFYSKLIFRFHNLRYLSTTVMFHILSLDIIYKIKEKLLDVELESIYVWTKNQMTFISDKIAIRRCFLFIDQDAIQKHSSSYIGLVICQQMRYYLLPQAVKYHDSMCLLYRIKSKTDMEYKQSWSVVHCYIVFVWYQNCNING